jgi:hypothetical protein
MASQQRLQKASDPRASVQIDVAISGVPAPTPSVILSLFGPGDVIGLNPNALIRTWPKPDARNAEANYFPLIEFDQADLPWRFSPQANDTNQVKPWLCVVVIPTGKSRVIAATPAQPLAILNTDTSFLPDLDESHLWAHGQLHGPDIPDNNALANSLDNNPQYFSSRILSVSILNPETEYTAYLVPTFELGRRAGLGLGLDGPGGLHPAWTAGAGAVSLPVYYQWSFATGPTGDFASLVRKIHPKPLADGVGFRNMDVADPGLGLPPAFDSALPVDGALRRYPPEKAPDWSGPTKDTFVKQLIDLLNKPTELFKTDPTHPLVTPPLYGRWHAAQTEIGPTSPQWFQSLNEDPRTRVQTGAGTQAVQREQQELLAGAWDQVGEVRAANERARWMQLGIEISARLYQKSLGSIASARVFTFMKFTSPVLTRVLGSPATIARLLLQSPVSPGTLSSQLRRITRPRGPIARRQPPPASGPSLLERMNQGTFSPAPPLPQPSGVLSKGNAGGQIEPAWITPGVLAFLRFLPTLLLVIAIALIIIAVLLVFIAGPAVAMVVALIAAGAYAGAVFARRFLQNIEARIALRDGGLSGATVRALPIPPTFAPAKYPAGKTAPVSIATGAVAAQKFVAAAANAFDNLAIPPVQPPPLVPISFTDLRTSLMMQLNPRVTLTQAFRTQVFYASGAYQLAGAETGEVIAGPTFTKAFYESVKAVSQDWILPGVDQAEPNTASLVLTNQAAVEAFMVGGNHEMSRTLLYNEYPTDLRFTYFRQFWDSRTAPGAGASPEDFLDIKPIHTWGNTNLGDNTSRKQPAGEDDVVLFVRGEVLLRYPNTIIYAVPAVRNTTDPKLPPLIISPDADVASHVFPTLHGCLDPDIRFFGFPLTIQQVTSGDGWFFVLQQHPGEPVFGFNVDSRSPLVSFKEVTWTMVLGVAEGRLRAPEAPAAAAGTKYLSFKSPSAAVQKFINGLGPRTPTWGSSSAEVAWRTLRRPTRVAHHAKLMLGV